MKPALSHHLVCVMVAVGVLSPAVRAQEIGSLVVRIEGVPVPSNRVVAIVVDESIMVPPTAAVALRAESVARGGTRTRYRSDRRPDDLQR